ncbi:MAG: inositol monophosphatase family protein [Chitinivibrionales bacterium]
MNKGEGSKELNTALDAAGAAGEILSKGFKGGVRVDFKSDNSPVTEIDKAAEKAVLRIISERFPDDGFIGEETGEIPGMSGRTWVVDPLDGTRPYIRGIPTYSTLIAMLRQGVPVIGVASFPSLKETYYAEEGKGAFCNGTGIHVSDIADKGASAGSMLGLLQRGKKPEILRGFMEELDYMYGFMDAYSYMCVASGKLEVAVSLLDKSWDSAAPAAIVSEAGGEWGGLSGERILSDGGFCMGNREMFRQITAHYREGLAGTE